MTFLRLSKRPIDAPGRQNRTISRSNSTSVPMLVLARWHPVGPASQPAHRTQGWTHVPAPDDPGAGGRPRRLRELRRRAERMARGRDRHDRGIAVPVDWTNPLVSITLVGGDASVTLDQASNSPMTIMWDPVTGQVRAMLRDRRRPRWVHSRRRRCGASRSCSVAGFRTWRRRGGRRRASVRGDTAYLGRIGQGYRRTEGHRNGSSRDSVSGMSKGVGRHWCVRTIVYFSLHNTGIWDVYTININKM